MYMAAGDVHGSISGSCVRGVIVALPGLAVCATCRLY